MKMRFEKEADFSEFKEELRERLQERQPRSIDVAENKPSAVKMLLMNKNGEPFVLLTKRSEKLRSHRGQVSFPGGGYDDEDESIRHTAYRETYEEVGIPSEKIEYIGQFDDYISIAGYHVSCFVGAIEHPMEYRINRDEIDAWLEAPLAMFVNKECDRTEQFHHNGKNYTVFYYYYEGFEIWGLTARLLTDFAQKICKD
ncbi:MAG: CoA pyrophosphatase [bacterium]|nr:CoA pyrophosphatase [bacterium]